MFIPAVYSLEASPLKTNCNSNERMKFSSEPLIGSVLSLIKTMKVAMKLVC